MPSSRFDALNFSLQFLWTFGVVFAPFLCIDLMTSELVCVIIVVSHLLCILAFPGRSSALFVPVRWITNPNYNQSHIFGLVDLFSCRSQFAFLFIFTSFSSFTDAIAPLPEVKLFTLCIVCVCVSAFATHSNHLKRFRSCWLIFVSVSNQCNRMRQALRTIKWWNVWMKDTGTNFYPVQLLFALCHSFSVFLDIALFVCSVLLFFVFISFSTLTACLAIIVGRLRNRFGHLSHVFYFYLSLLFTQMWVKTNVYARVFAILMSPKKQWENTNGIDDIY